MIPTEELKEKLVNAYFTDDLFGTVEVLYKYGDSGGLGSFMFDYSRDELMKQSLADAGVDEETLINNTETYRRNIISSRNSQIHKVARELAKEMIGSRDLEKEKIELSQAIKNTKIELGNKLFDSIKENNEDQDQTFKFKLWALEQEELKNANKETKSKLRKAKTIFDAMSLYNEVLKEGK